MARYDDDTKDLEITPLESELIDWLIDPERSGTMSAWSLAHGKGADWARRAKRREHVRREIARRASELNVDTERIQQVVNAMHGRAIRGDVQAAKLYLEFTRQILPPVQIHQHVDARDASDLSDEELLRELESQLEQERKHLRLVEGSNG